LPDLRWGFEAVALKRGPFCDLSTTTCAVEHTLRVAAAFDENVATEGFATTIDDLREADFR
jgi:hypothetical protein